MAKGKGMALIRGMAMFVAAAAAAIDARRHTQEVGMPEGRRVYGPRVTATKNIGRDWLKASRNSQRYDANGNRECARRAGRKNQHEIVASNHPGPQFNRAPVRAAWRAEIKTAHHKGLPDPRIALRAARKAARKAAA